MRLRAGWGKALLKDAVIVLTGVVVLLGMPSQGGAQEENPPQAAPEPDDHLSEGFLGQPLTGYVSARMRSRWTGDDADLDQYQTLALDWGDEREHSLTVHALARLSEDFWGNRDTRGFFPFDNIQDTYSSPVTGRLYYAYADIHRMGLMERGRVGRQFLEDTPTPLHFDGIRLDSEPVQLLRALQAGAYGGIPVHPFESSPDGDSLFGAYAQASPWKGARARLDYTRAGDETDEGEAFRNDLFGAGLWQSLGSTIQLHYQRVFLDRTPREQRARAIVQEPDWDLQVQLHAYQLMDTEEVLAVDFDSFVTVLREYAPYRQGGVTVGKGFGANLNVDAGVEARELEHNSGEGFGNREFVRYFVSPSVQGVGWKGLSTAMTFERWDVRGDDNGDFWTVGADVTHKCTETLKVSMGTAYALTRYDFLLEEERQEVRTVYARTIWAATPRSKIDVGWEYERSHYNESDLNNFHVLKIGITYFLGKP